MPSLRFISALLLAVLIGAGVVARQAQQAQPTQQAPANADPSRLTVRIIVVGTSDEAERVLQRVKSGDAFAALARALSIDPSARSGGLLGAIDPTALRGDVQRALQGLPIGQFSPVVQVATGFAVLQVVPDTGGTPAAINPASLAAISAVGSVKYVPDVGGLPEAEAVLREFPKAADWNMDPRAICQARQDSLFAGAQLFEDFFAPAQAAIRNGRPPFELMQAHLGHAQLLAYQGSMTRAVEHYEQAYQLAKSGVPGALAQVEEMLGVAYLHKAGMDSGVFRQPDDFCLLPNRPGRAYAKTTDVEKAIVWFTTYLERRPDDLEVQWLLNLAYMALGTYPDGVPAKYRIAASAFASAEDVGRFRDVGTQTGLNVFAAAGGVIVDDFTGSGRLDVVTSNWYACSPMHYFANSGDGTFTDRSTASGFRDQVGGLNLVQADYNNDRCTDILVLRGGWEVPQRNSLLKNNCDGTFTDVTSDAGLAAPATSTQTAAWADVNNDGNLDLFVGNENQPAQLFLSDGHGHFTDIAKRAGVGQQSFAKGVAAGDYDNDGFVDFYVSNYDGANFLYRNKHDSSFEERAIRCRSAWSWTRLCDLVLRLRQRWVARPVRDELFHVGRRHGAHLPSGLPHNASTMKLYRNRGNGSFEDVTTSTGLDKVFMPMGANFGDIDNDGFLDMYLGMGTPSYASIAPHVLLRNKSGKTFVDVTASSGTGEIHKGHGVAFADLDNDGDEDIVAEIGGATPGDSHAMRVFENPGHGNDWIALKLTGVTSNRSALGARITVSVENGDGSRRTINRQVSSGGSFGASPLEQHIGLGRAPKTIDVDIWWPASNTRQHFSDVPRNAVFAVEERATTLTRIERKPVRLGGQKRAE